MNIDELQTLIEEKRNEYDEESQEVLDKWLKDLFDVEAILQLKENKTVKALLKRIEQKIEGIDLTLSRTRELHEDIEIDKRMRNYLFDKKELLNSFVALFKVDNKVEEIKQKLV